MNIKCGDLANGFSKENVSRNESVTALSLVSVKLMQLSFGLVVFSLIPFSS